MQRGGEEWSVRLSGISPAWDIQGLAYGTRQHNENPTE